MRVEQQVMILYAVTNGLIDDIPTARVRAFELGFHEYMRTQKPEIGEAIRSTGKLEKDTAEALTAAPSSSRRSARSRTSATTAAQPHPWRSPTRRVRPRATRWSRERCRRPSN
jgi:hypothetical protein